jgi:outer membrane protein assembly factor BamA
MRRLDWWHAALGLPITDNLSTQIAYNLTKEEYVLSASCDNDGRYEPEDSDGVPSGPAWLRPRSWSRNRNSPWVKSSVSGSLQYNSIDDMKNPQGHLCQLHDGSRGPRRRRQMGEVHRAWHLLQDAV